MVVKCISPTRGHTFYLPPHVAKIRICAEMFENKKESLLLQKIKSKTNIHGYIGSLKFFYLLIQSFQHV